MTRLFAIAISFVLLTAFVVSAQADGAMAMSAERHAGLHIGDHTGHNDPEHGTISAASALCQFYCTSAAELSVPRIAAHRIGWLREIYPIEGAVAPRVIRPEVAERPPKPVFV